MLTAGRALAQNVDRGRELPRVEAFRSLYERGVRPRHGQIIMIAGRSGAGKSAFAMYWAAQMNLRTLYFSADMDASTASRRLVSMHTGDSDELVAVGLKDERTRREYLNSVRHLNLTFSFMNPITWRGIDEELEAYVELWDAYPEVIVIDNIMDLEGAEASYEEQMAAMQGMTEMARTTGATTFVLHHATDKSKAAQFSPNLPPPRNEIKGGLSEKPELSLSVALNQSTHEFHVAVLKQRSGPSDPSAETYATLHAQPETNRFFQTSLAAQLQHRS